MVINCYKTNQRELRGFKNQQSLILLRVWAWLEEEHVSLLHESSAGVAQLELEDPHPT